MPMVYIGAGNVGMARAASQNMNHMGRCALLRTGVVAMQVVGCGLLGNLKNQTCSPPMLSHTELRWHHVARPKMGGLIPALLMAPWDDSAEGHPTLLKGAVAGKVNAAETESQDDLPAD